MANIALTPVPSGTSPIPERAIEFSDGDVLIGVKGIGYRSREHIILAKPHGISAIPLGDSQDLFLLAPSGVSFTVTAE